jgi:transposase
MCRRDELDPRCREWIGALLSHPANHGGCVGKRNDHEALINGILRVLQFGAPWRDAPELPGPWRTVFNRWRGDETWSRIVTRLLDYLERHGRAGRTQGDATARAA